MNICHEEIDHCTSSLSNDSCVTVITKPGERKKHNPKQLKQRVLGTSIINNKSEKSVEHQPKSKFTVRFKKNATVDQKVKKKIGSTCEKSARRKPSLINPNSVKRQKCQYDLLINPDSVDGQAMAPCKTIPPSKQYVKKQKCKDGFYDIVPSAVDFDTNTETTLVNETPSNKGLKRQKSQNGLVRCGVSSERQQTFKRRKSEDVFGHCAAALYPQPETSQKKVVRRKSKDFIVPNAISLDTQPITPLDKEYLSPRARRASNRRKSKEDIEPSADSLFSQSLTLGQLSPNKVVKRRKPKDALAPRVVFSETPVTPLDGEKIINKSNNGKPQDSNVDHESSAVDGNTQCATNFTDLTSMEDLLLESPTSSPGVADSYDRTCYTETEHATGDISGLDDSLENIIEHIKNPTFEVDDVSKSVCANFNESASVESMLASPESLLEDEVNCTSTDNDGIKSCIIKSSPIKECNIVIERLDLRHIYEFNQKNGKQKEADKSFKCSAEPEDHSSEVMKPRLVESNCKYVSTLDPTETTQEIVPKFPKPSTTIESVGPSNFCLVTNDLIAPNTTVRPKLKKASILKMKPKLKCPNFKQINTVNKTNNLFGMERSVAFCGGENNTASIVITKKFTKSEIKNNENMGMVRKELDSGECSVTKQNLQNGSVSFPKSNKTLTTFSDEFNPLKIVEGKPLNDAVVKQKSHLETKLQGEDSFVCGEFATREGSVAEQNLQNSSKSIKTHITFHDDFDHLNKLVEVKHGNDGVVKLKIKDTQLQEKNRLVFEQYDNQECAFTKQNCQNAHGPKSNKSCITFNDHFDLMDKKVKHIPQNDRVVKLKTHEELRAKASLVREQYDDQEIYTTKQNLQNTRGHINNKTYITFSDDIDQLTQKVKDKSRNDGIVKCKTQKDKLREKTITTEPNLRKLITFKDNDKLYNAVAHNSPSPCGINIRSNLGKDLEPSIHGREPSSEFCFAQPEALPKKKVVVQTNDDDISSELSFFVSDDLENDIDNVVTEPKQNETTWKKFDRFSKDSDDEEGDEYNNFAVMTSKCNDIKEQSGVDIDDDEVSVKTENSYAPPPLTIDRLASWNRLNNKLSSKDDQQKQAITLKENKANRVCDYLLGNDPLQDSPLKGYCTLYFRESIDDHTCNLIHTVPYHLFSDISLQDAEKLDCAISEIINKNFNNPPAALVFTFVSFCVQFNKRTTLVRLGKCLKNNFNVRCANQEKANEIWYDFLKAIIDSKYVAIPNIQKCRFISMTLYKIFGENIDLKEEDAEVFKVILEALVKVNLHYKSKVQLLMCVNFMFERGSKNRLNLKLFSHEFAISVIKQCLDSLNQSNQSSNKFAYKVASNFLLNDFAYVKGLYKHDKNIVTSFVETVEYMGVLDWSRNYKVKQLVENGSEKPSLESRKRSESGSSSSRHSTKTCSELPTIESASDSLSLCAALERNFKSKEFSPEEIYNLLKSTCKKEQFFNALTLLNDNVKETLSDVIMSFISYEANNNQWSICFKLYKSLLHFDPKTIKNLDGDNSPASSVLTVVLVLLKNNKIAEAFNLFTEYNLCKDQEDWSLNYLLEDVATSRHICSIFEETIQSLDDETLYSVTIKLVTLQKSLAEPIDLTERVSYLFNRLIERKQHSKTVKLLSLIFDENKSKLLTLPSVDLYRSLVTILCIEEDLTHASMFFFKAEKRVHLYPSIPKSTIHISPVKAMSVELYSCLTKEEMKVAVFAILKLHGEIIKNSGFYVKFKVYYNRGEEKLPWAFKPYISLKDCTIPTAIRRFRESVRELIPNAIFKQRGHDAIEIEKVSLKEYVYNQNKSDASDEG